MTGADTPGVVTIKQITMNYKARWEDYSMARYMHLEQMVINAIKYLKIFTVSNINVVYLTQGATPMIELPSDFISYSKVGIIDACGRLWTLTLNPEMYGVPGEQCGVDISTALSGRCGCDGLQSFYYAPHVYNGEFIDTLYSVGGGFNIGYYNFNLDDRKLITDLPQGTTIVLEYQSSGIKSDGSTLIPEQFTEAIIAWVDWQEAKRGKIPVNSEQARRDFINEETLLKALMRKKTASEWYDLIWSTWYSGVKRG